MTDEEFQHEIRFILAALDDVVYQYEVFGVEVAVCELDKMVVTLLSRKCDRMKIEGDGK